MYIIVTHACKHAFLKNKRSFISPIFGDQHITIAWLNCTINISKRVPSTSRYPLTDEFSRKIILLCIIRECIKS